MSEEKLSLKGIPFKHKVILTLLFIGGAVLVGLSQTSYLMVIKSILLYGVLLIASIFDYKFRVIPDWIHLLIMLIGLIDFHIMKSVLGLLLSALPFLIMALLQPGSIGGGDIKLIGATGFTLGCFKTTTASMIGIIVVLLFYSFYYFSIRRTRHQSFPFAPFFQIGCTMVMVFGGT